ncbi:MAG: tetratricopeptide repeat protein [Deltaproteobacteria bacterium]|jgi:TolA-binding protein|nr:tetratricopeptide repeat protein [Deltaproteobacteria bacterium]
MSSFRDIYSQKGFFGLATLVMVFFWPIICLAAPNQLKNIALGGAADYNRLVFTFSEPLNDVILRREDVHSLNLDFGQALPGQFSRGPTNDLIQSINLTKDDDRLIAQVTLRSNRFEVRHFLSRDRFSCVVDVKSLSQDEEADTSATPTSSETILDQSFLNPPSLSEVVSTLSLFIQPNKNPNSPENLLQRAFNNLNSGDYDGAIAKFDAFKANYPNHPYSDPALFVLGDAYMAKGLADNFNQATTAWQDALNAYPNSLFAPRASFMIAEAYRLNGYRNEAAGYYKLFAQNYPDSPLAPLAILRAADLELSMGLNDQARETVAPLASKSLASKFTLLARGRLAMADYMSSLYSQACEKFIDILDHDPNIYLYYPDMLYALGDSYSYLNRPDLTVSFLEHALNVMPNHPKADVMLARIGNALQSLGLHKEAISYFNVAKDVYPDRDGGLVSQIRLADMGAIQAFFSPDQVFDALERGSNQATVKMYDKIISQASDSPLLQLAYLKIGQAQAADGENAEAIKWLRTLISKYPKGILLNEAKPIMSRAVVNEAQERFNLGHFEELERLNFDNYSFLEGPDRLRFLRLLAQSYENMGRADDALRVWKDIEDLSPEKRLADQKEVIEAALKAGQPLEAFRQIKDSFKEFPEQAELWNEKIAQVGRIMARPANDEAVNNLLSFYKDPLVEERIPISQLALSDAIAILVKNKNYERASSLMDDYREKFPLDELSPEYLLTQAKIDRRLGQTQRAWDRLSNFRMDYPNDERVPSTILETINDAKKNNLYPDAYRYEELYRQIYPDDLKSRNLLLARAEEQWKLGDNQGAIETLNYFQEEYPNDPETPATFIDQYQKLMDIKETNRAFAALDKMRRLFPNDPLTLNSYVTQYHDAIKVKEPEVAFAALNEFQRLFPDDPRQPDLLLEEAKDYFTLNRLDDGLAAWNSFLGKYPQDPRTADLLLLQARLELKENRQEPALSHYHEFINSYPVRADRPDVMLELAAIEKNLGLNQEAFNDLFRFRQDYPGHPNEAQAILDQIELAINMSQIDQAVALYSVFRDNFPRHPRVTQTFLDETRQLLAAGRSSQAVSILEEGILKTPDLDKNRQVQDLLLGLYLDEGRAEDWAGASEEFLGREEPNPNNLADRFNKYTQVAQVYQELGRQADAERNYDLALSNRPPDVTGESLFAIAGGYKRMGRNERYRSTLEIISALPDPLWQNVANQELNRG